VYPEYPFRSHFLDLAAGRLHYLDEGSGPVVLMLHGNPTWSYYFRKLIAQLRDQYRVIAVDHLGCGLSAKPQEYSYTLAGHIANLEALLAHLGLTRFSLVVHDWGGAIGFGCAVRRPAAIERIVVMNSAAFRSTRIPWRIKICRLPRLGEFLVRRLNGFAGPARFMAVRRPLPPAVAKAYLAPYDSWQNRVAIYRFVADIPLAPDHPSYPTLVAIEDGLAGLRRAGVPLLLLWGGSDFCFTEHFYHEWRLRFPEAEGHFFPDAGHYLLEDAAAQVLPLVSRFLRPLRQEAMT
jgi:cis-3-alkyl-4-acyloxetan-2-one decarboxylase